MPNFISRSVPSGHFRSPSLPNRVSYAWASRSNRLTSFFSRPQTAKSTPPNEKPMEYEIENKAPELVLDLHRSLPPLPPAAAQGNSRRSSLLSIDIDRLFTRFRGSFIETQRGSNTPDVPRSVTMRESSEVNVSSRRQTMKRPTTGDSTDSEGCLDSDLNHSRTAVISSASAVPVVALSDTQEPVTLTRGGSARYVHYSGKKSMSGSVSLWSSKRDSTPFVPPVPLSPTPFSPTKSESGNSETEAKVKAYRAQVDEVPAPETYLSPLSGNTRDSEVDASKRHSSNSSHSELKSSESEGTPLATKDSRLTLITSFPEPPSPGPVSNSSQSTRDTFGRPRSGRERYRSAASSKSGSSATSSSSSRLRKTSDATIRPESSSNSHEDEDEDKDKFEIPRIEGAGSGLRRSDTVSR